MCIRDRSGNTTLQSGSVFELTLSMGGSAGHELAYNSLMLHSGVFQIDAGAKLKLAALSLDYSFLLYTSRCV